MIKVDIAFKNKSWQVKEALACGAFSYDSFNSLLKRVQKQTNEILTQLVDEESGNGQEISDPDNSDADNDAEPEKKRSKK